MDYPHLFVMREQIITVRPRRLGFSAKVKWTDQGKRSHGELLFSSLKKVREQESSVNGFDDRKLIKIELSDKALDIRLFENIQGVKIISQENKQIVLLFAKEEGLDEFKKRLTNLKKGEKVTREALVLAMKNFDFWRPEDRMGLALKNGGFPNTETFILDVELWPQDLSVENQEMLTNFLEQIKKRNIEFLDKIEQTSLVMVRVRTTKEQANNFLLCHRDVRTVDLPPRFGLQTQLLLTDISKCPVLPSPKDAPVIGVLDTGIVAGHPLLKDSVGDNQSYLNPSPDSLDAPAHGTFVAGLALYGDIEEILENSKQFKPELRILSGKVFSEGNNNNPEFIENSIDRAVRALHNQYGCRVFNLSYGDLNKVYDGGHLKGLGYTLDCLTRELKVLFVVPTGNLVTQDTPKKIREEYPDYLLAESSRLLDPATAINVLTVGGYAKHEATFEEKKYLESFDDLPVTRLQQPSPFTRRGPSIGGAIKPELVEFAGNVAEKVKAGNHRTSKGLGIVSLNSEMVGGLFCEGQGTSFAAPVIAHQAAKILKTLPDASPNLLRALIGANAKIPEVGKKLFKNGKSAKERKNLLNLYGYGILDKQALFYSHENLVTLIAEESIKRDTCHFFELPIPEDFLLSNLHREISISLAYSPAVKTNRIDYRMTKLSFRFILAASLDEASKAFQKGKDKDDSIKELCTSQRWISSDDRGAGTLQVSSWLFKKKKVTKEKMFLVVMRQDQNWSSVTEEKEPYALVIRVAQKDNLQLYSNVKNILSLRQEGQAQDQTQIRI